MIERAVVEAGGVAAAAGTAPRDAPIVPAGGETAESALVASPEHSGGPAAEGDADARSDDGVPGMGGANGTHGAIAPAADETGAARAAGEVPGEEVARPPMQEDLTLVLTVLLGTPGEDLTVVVGARRGERPHGRFARLTLPRDGWIASLFRGGDPATGGGEPAATLAAYVANANAALAEGSARTSTARPAGGQSHAQGATGGRRRQQASGNARRSAGEVAPAGETVAATGGTAALLAQRKAGQSTAPAQGTPPTRRSLFDLEDDLS